MDSYNAAHPHAEPIQVVFDFTMDLAELEAADEARIVFTNNTPIQDLHDATLTASPLLIWIDPLVGRNRALRST